jgi:nucleoside triphosphate pyrophosphatase
MIIQPDVPVILASASPRRREILDQLGLNFKVIPAHINEIILKDETPITHVCRLAREKGNVLARVHRNAYIISSDTIVIYKNQILGKPEDKKDALSMLKMLSGNKHEVITAFTITCKDRDLQVTEYERTQVRFRDLCEDEIKAYIESGSPMDKAGAYGIQDLKANLVEGIEGCFYNVIGFPAAKFKTVWDQLISKSS